MKISRYFSDLNRAYSDELDDLITDSDGKMVLQKRLNIKRKEIDAILPMIDFSPEMVSVVFYGAFGFSSAATMQAIAQSEPGKSGFPGWDALTEHLLISEWAAPLITASLKAGGGDIFLVSTAVLEFMRGQGVANESSLENDPTVNPSDGDEDDDQQDLAEAGADWLAEQGFETTRH